eukprot:gene17882-19665_t
MPKLQNFPSHIEVSEMQTRTPPPSRRKARPLQRSHSQGSSPMLEKCQMNYAKASKTRTSNVKHQAHMVRSPFLARAVHYSEGRISPLATAATSSASPEPEKRQKSKSFLKKNFLLSRLRSGSSHASSSGLENGTKGGQEGIGKADEGPAGGVRAVSEQQKRIGPTSIEYKVVQEENELSGLIRHILESHMCKVEFDHTKSSELCGLLSKVLEKSVKSRLARYGKTFKISATVYMAEVRDDGMKMATQCAWEPNQDHFAMATYETETIFVVAMVFAILYKDATTCE